jgi:hypothetical protein
MNAASRPKPHHIIGLGGHARSGKDTVAAYLIERYGFVRYAFADALRYAALALDPIVDFSWDIDAITWARTNVRLSEVVAAEGWETAKERPEVRRTLQRYGVAIRELQPDFWINAALSKVADETRPVVVTDVRFPNEVDAIRDRGGLFARVTRPGATGNGHISEHAIDHIPADINLDNSGSLLDLAAVVDRALTGRLSS